MPVPSAPGHGRFLLFVHLNIPTVTRKKDQQFEVHGTLLFEQIRGQPARERGGEKLQTRTLPLGKESAFGAHETGRPPRRAKRTTRCNRVTRKASQVKEGLERPHWPRSKRGAAAAVGSRPLGEKLRGRCGSEGSHSNASGSQYLCWVADACPRTTRRTGPEPTNILFLHLHFSVKSFHPLDSPLACDIPFWEMQYMLIRSDSSDTGAPAHARSVGRSARSGRTALAGWSCSLGIL